MKSAKRKSSSAATPVRVRSMATGFIAVGALIAFPLLVVWKQAFISGASMRIERMNDTLSLMNREIATLRFRSDRLSTNDRIESIAQTSLNLEYPPSDRITFVSCGKKGGGR
jgi:hypothetical protein